MKRKAMKKWLATTSAFALVVSMIPMNIQTAFADSVPTMNAYQLNDHVKLEWAVDMLDSNVITQTSFESGQEIPNFVVGGNSGSGNQSIVNGIAYSGSRSIQLTNTITNNSGNAWWFPATYSDMSIGNLLAKRIPNGTNLSITFKARAVGGSTSWVGFSNNSPWSQQGIPFADASGKTLRFGQTMNFANPPSEFSAYVDGGGVPNLADKQLFTFVSSHRTDHNWGVIFYQWNVAKGKFEFVPGQATYTWGSGDGFGNPYTVYNDVFNVGEPILHLEWIYVGFNGRNVPTDGSWVTFSSNTYMDSPHFNFYNQGFIPQIHWRTDSQIQIDDIKFGYATRTQVFKNGSGTALYDGYLSDYEDTAATDTAKPNAVANVTATESSGKGNISWSASADNGTTYNYTVRSVNQQGVATTLSQNYPVIVKTGIKGYSVVVDQSPTTVPDNVIETTGTSYQTPTNVNGNYYVHVATVDNAGNVSAPVHISYTDVTAPNLSVTPSTTSPTNQDVILTATASDGETGVKRIQKPDGIWVSASSTTFAATTNGNYTFAVEDNAGNQTTKSITVSNIDKVLPTGGAVTLVDGSLVNKNSYRIRISGVSDTGSGISKVSFPTWTINNGQDDLNPNWANAELGTNLGGGVWEYLVNVSAHNNEDGVYTTHIYAFDNAGNQVMVNSASVTVDRIAPAVATLTASITNPTNQNVDVAITYPADASVKEYRIGTGGAWTPYTAKVTLSSNNTVYARSMDAAGNTSAESSISVSNIDKVAPANASISANVTGPTNQNVTLTVSYPGDAAVKEVRLNGGAWTAYIAPVAFSANGMLEARSTDVSGNVSAVRTYNVTNIDKIAPVETVITPNTVAPTNQNVTLILEYPSDAVVKEYKVGNGSWTAYTQPLLVSSNVTVYARSKDEAGNLSNESSLVVSNIDKTAPSNPVVHLSGNELSIVAGSDGQSGVKETLVSINGGAWIVYNDKMKLPDGNYRIDVKTVDEAGNESATMTVNELLYGDALKLATKAVEKAQASKSQADVDAAKGLISNLPSSAVEKAGLSDALDHVQAEIDFKALNDRIRDIQRQVDQGGLTPERITQLEDQLRELLEGLNNLPAYVNTDDAKKQVSDLKDTLEIADDVLKLTKSSGDRDIDSLRDEVNSLPASSLKDELFAKIKDVVDLKEATKQVSKLENELTLIDLDDATDLAESLPDSPEKDALFDRISEAENQINANESLNKVENSFSKADFDKAWEDALKVTNEEKRNQLLDKLNQIKPIVDAIVLVQKAEVTRSQEDVNAAREKVNGLVDGEMKDSLNNRLDAIDKAYQDAKAKVEFAEKFKVDSYIKTAEGLVDKMVISPAKDSLQARLDSIKNELSAKQLADFLVGVESKVKLAEQYKRDPYLANAFDAVNALPSIPEKQSFLNRLNAIVTENNNGLPVEVDGKFNPGDNITDVVNTIKDPLLKVPMVNWAKAVERAERYVSKGNIKYALEKMAQVPVSVATNPKYRDLYNEMKRRSENLKKTYNDMVANQALEREISVVENDIVAFETYKTQFFKTKTQNSVNSLSSDGAKQILQARIDAVVMK